MVSDEELWTVGSDQVWITIVVVLLQQMRGCSVEEHWRQNQRQRAGILSTLRMQIREPKYVRHQGGSRDGDLGDFAAGRLHAVPDFAGAVAQQAR